jgi:hypothetical protein
MLINVCVWGGSYEAEEDRWEVTEEDGQAEEWGATKWGVSMWLGK